MSTLQQLSLYGPPEQLEDLSEQARVRDDAPVPCERELLWPLPHAEMIGGELLERLYGDVPRRSRLTVIEVCRRLRCGHSHVYDLIDCGSLDALDSRHPNAVRANYTIYRYSLVRFLFRREFVESQTRANLPAEDMRRCMALADRLKKETKERMR